MASLMLISLLGKSGSHVIIPRRSTRLSPESEIENSKRRINIGCCFVMQMKSYDGVAKKTSDPIKVITISQ